MKNAVSLAHEYTKAEVDLSYYELADLAGRVSDAWLRAQESLAGDYLVAAREATVAWGDLAARLRDVVQAGAAYKYAVEQKDAAQSAANRAADEQDITSGYPDPEGWWLQLAEREVARTDLFRGKMIELAEAEQQKAKTVEAETEKCMRKIWSGEFMIPDRHNLGQRRFESLDDAREYAAECYHGWNIPPGEREDFEREIMDSIELAD